MHRPLSSELTWKDKVLNETEKWTFIRTSTRLAFKEKGLKREKLDEMSTGGLDTNLSVLIVILEVHPCGHLSCSQLTGFPKWILNLVLGKCSFAPPVSLADSFLFLSAPRWAADTCVLLWFCHPAACHFASFSLSPRISFSRNLTCKVKETNSRFYPSQNKKLLCKINKFS